MVLGFGGIVAYVAYILVMPFLHEEAGKEGVFIGTTRRGIVPRHRCVPFLS